MSTGWEDRAEGWIAWARTPGHDACPVFREAFFELLPPSSGRRVLEVGCGEGRVCRDLRARGYDTIGLDASTTLVAAAREADPAGEYVVGVAESLPFEDGSFDLVASYVLEQPYVAELDYRFDAARDGLEFVFESRSYPLRAYSAALEQAGLLIEALREPEGADPHDRFLPEFLLFRAAKPPL